jgi:hypothetical protein
MGVSRFPRKPCLKGVKNMDSSQQFAAMFDEHQVTDSEGQVKEDDTSTEVSSQEPTEVEEPTKAEKPAESDVKESQPLPEEDETQPVEDEEGRKYVPEKRFKEVYAKQKEAERKAQAYEAQLRALSSQAPTPQPAARDRIDALETESLFNQYPQFNPSNPEYDEDLDRVAASIYVAGSAATKTEAARQAINLAKKLQSKTTSMKEETKTFKRSVSEGNIVKPGQRVEAQVNPDTASLEDLEREMRATGNWGKPTS